MSTSEASNPALPSKEGQVPTKVPPNKTMSSAAQKREQTRVVKKLASMSEKEERLHPLTIQEVSALFDRSAKTLEKDRAEQRAAFEAGTPIPPHHPAALKFDQAKDGGPVTYFAAHALEHLKARFDAAEGRLGAAPASAARGFQTWLQEATAIETWPFTIRQDGRPVDMIDAMETGRLTGRAERLTPREFGDRMAQAASEAFHRDEANALEAEASPAAKASSQRRGPI